MTFRELNLFRLYASRMAAALPFTAELLADLKWDYQAI